MYIKDLHIKNFKGFGDVDLTFDPRINVFIGNNSSGKTSLLVALLKAIYNTTKIFVPLSSDPISLGLTYNDIKYNEISCRLKISIEGFPGYYKNITSGIQVNLPGYTDASGSDRREEIDIDFFHWFSSEIETAGTTLPIFKYYSANRGAVNFKVEQSRPKDYKISQLESWANLTQDDLSYSRFFNWFHDNEINELRLQRDSNDFNVKSPALEGVRIALSKTFDTLGYGNVIIKIQQISNSKTSRIIPKLVIENVNTKQVDELENKSYGEKALIILISDIAYNLSLAKDFTSDNDFLNSPGVVLVDEIENHLHPSWQREMIPVLLKIFPNIQFFLATHSPQIIAAVKSSNIFICDRFSVRHLNLKTKGEDSNTLLRYIFNSTDRPKEYIELIERFHSLMDENADENLLMGVIERIMEIEKQDNATDINSLVDELRLELEAYKFDKEHEVDH